MKLIIVLTALLAACSSLKYPPCVLDNMHELTISWGDHDLATGKIEGYKLDAYGRLFSMERDTNGTDYRYTYMKQIPDTLFCKVNNMVIKEIMKVPALNSAIDIERFIEYNNPGQNSANVRSSWNPKYETKASKGFIVMYDFLNQIIEDKN